MRFHHPAALAATLLALTACEQPQASSSAAALDTEEQKASYAIGRNVGQSLVPAADRLDKDAFLRGVDEALAGTESAVPEQELQMALQGFSRSVMQQQEEAQGAEAEANRAEGQAYLAENRQREGVETTESGLQYEVLEAGDGPRPEPTDQVRLHYRGTLTDGTQFDSSYERGEPTEFGVTQVIPGFSEGLQLMPVGSKYRFVIPSDLAYGPGGRAPSIGPDETLIFEVELLEILEIL